jgi:hypothetical protein
MANRLFEEAAHAGLIREDGGGFWRWRHGLVAEYLASLSVYE